MDAGLARLCARGCMVRRVAHEKHQARYGNKNKNQTQGIATTSHQAILAQHMPCTGIQLIAGISGIIAHTPNCR